MVDINLNAETPSQSVIAKANAEYQETDAQGRTISVRKLRAIDRMRLFEVIGADNATNPQYFGFAMMAYSVVSIDGETLAKPANKLQLEAVVNRLEDDGLEAIGRAFKVLYPENDLTAEEQKDILKNE